MMVEGKKVSVDKTMSRKGVFVSKTKVCDAFTPEKINDRS